MKKTIIFLILILPVFLISQEYQRKNFRVKLGQIFSTSLEEGEKGKWEIRVINKDLIRIDSKKHLNKKLEISLKMIKAGLARLEAVLIKDNKVKKRIFFFFNIQKAKKITKKKTVKAKTEDKSDKKVTNEIREFNFAKKIFENGHYIEAQRAFKIFRSKYPASDLKYKAYVYEGQTEFEVKNYKKALTLFRMSMKSTDNEIRYLSYLWIGYSNDALGNDSNAVKYYLDAITGLQYPDIELRARTGLALNYAKRKKFKLADMQFKRLFAIKSKKMKNKLGYILALYYAGNFYEKYSEIITSYNYYKKYRKKVERILMNKKLSNNILNMLNKYDKIAKKRILFLEKNFINYH